MIIQFKCKKFLNKKEIKTNLKLIKKCMNNKHENFQIDFILTLLLTYSVIKIFN